LERFAREGTIELLKVTNAGSTGGEYWLAGLAAAREKFNADWVLFQDADEFWLHASDSLQDLVSRTDDDVLLVNRFNACLSDSNIGFFANMNAGVIRQLDIFVQSMRLSSQVMNEDPSIRWSSGKPVEKVLARCRSIEAICAGGHGIIGAGGAMLPAREVEDAIIVHVPFSTFDRFKRKVSNVRGLFEANPNVFSGEGGWHWRRWVRILNEGGLEKEFGDQFLNANELMHLRAAGAICKAAEKSQMLCTQ
jgi:hypothetical protein